MIEKIIDIIKNETGKDIKLFKITDNNGNIMYNIEDNTNVKDYKLEWVFEKLNIDNIMTDITVSEDEAERIFKKLKKEFR